MVGDGGEEQDPDSGRTAGAVHAPDRVGLARAAAQLHLGLVPMVVRVRMAVRDGVRMQMSMLGLPVAVGVGVERPGPPADEQAHRESDDHQPHKDLGQLLEPLGQVALEEHDRQPEQHERRRVPESPREPETRGAAAPGSSSAGMSAPGKVP